MDLDLELSVSVYDVNMRIVVPYFSTNQDFMECPKLFWTPSWYFRQRFRLVAWGDWLSSNRCQDPRILPKNCPTRLRFLSGNIIWALICWLEVYIYIPKNVQNSGLFEIYYMQARLMCNYTHIHIYIFIRYSTFNTHIVLESFFRPSKANKNHTLPLPLCPFCSHDLPGRYQWFSKASIRLVAFGIRIARVPRGSWDGWLLWWMGK